MKPRLASKAGCLSAALPLALVLCGGCSSPGPSTQGYGVGQLAHRERSAVFTAAEAALVQLGYRVEHRDVDAGILTSYSLEIAPGHDVGQPRARFGSTPYARTVAEVRVGQDAETVNVYCKVTVQEQSTEVHRILALDQQSSDTPAHTPIEREAATTRAQNTVWRTTRRDSLAERRILAAITKRVTELPPSADANP